MLISRFLESSRNNRDTLQNIASAYALLRENAGYRELGISAAMVSHEIRNYVATLRGNVTLMAGADGSDASALASVRATADRLELISRDIAAFSSLPPTDLGEGSMVRMDEIIRGCLARHFPGSSGRFRLETPSGIPPLRASPDRLDQDFLNLFRNAFEAGARTVDIRIRVWGGRLIVAVEDDGSGCAVEDLANIGTPFC